MQLTLGLLALVSLPLGWSPSRWRSSGQVLAVSLVWASWFCPAVLTLLC